MIQSVTSVLYRVVCDKCFKATQPGSFGQVLNSIRPTWYRVDVPNGRFPKTIYLCERCGKKHINI